MGVKLVLFQSEGRGNFQNDAMPSFALDSKVLYTSFQMMYHYESGGNQQNLFPIKVVPSQLHTTVNVYFIRLS